MEPLAIRTTDLTRTYRRPRKGWLKRRRGPVAVAESAEFVALGGVSLEVRSGELFGLLGPNGAGKTTLIKILTTLLAPSRGEAFVDGFHVVREAAAIRPRINMVSGGESSGYGILTVRETLWLFARIYGVPNAEIRRRTDELLDIVGLAEKANNRVSHLSTGQRQKMNFCRGFLTDPKILFLDEPTLGLDVTAARAIRAFVRNWIKDRDGHDTRTMLLTTHYMAEADDLCDRLAIIDRGQVLACDTPANLKKRVQEFPIFELSLAPSAGAGSLVSQLERLSGVKSVTTSETPVSLELKVALAEDAIVGGVVQTIVERGAKIQTLKKVEPTLEDVFIELVGHGLGEPAADASGRSS